VSALWSNVIEAKLQKLAMFQNLECAQGEEGIGCDVL
jgi:hypothetical protein